MKTIVNGLRLFIVLSIMTGLFYPLAMTGILSAMFPKTTAGSMVRLGGHVIGSELLAQPFTDPRYFWPRPSAANYKTVPSGASNFGPTSAALKATAQKRAADWRSSQGIGIKTEIPADMLFASGSGLDPHISPEAARQQIGRVCRSRSFSEIQIRRCHALVQQMTESPQFGFFGKARINVLLLNLRLDESSPDNRPPSPPARRVSK